MLDVASLDKGLFATLQEAYDAVAELEHVRSSLIYHVAPEDVFDTDFLDGFIEYAMSELDDIHGQLEKLYLECTKTKLTDHRLR